MQAIMIQKGVNYAQYCAQNLTLDPREPLDVNVLTGPEIFTEIKYQQKQAMDRVFPVMEEIGMFASAVEAAVFAFYLARENKQTWLEPGAGIPHAEICAEAAE